MVSGTIHSVTIYFVQLLRSFCIIIIVKYNDNKVLEVKTMSKKVLILSVSAGGGHNSAAAAIKGALENLNCEVTVVDTLKFVSPTLDKLVSGGYEKSAKYAPRTFGALYKLSGKKSRKENLDSIVSRTIGKKVFKLIEELQPDAVIGTHPFPTMALMRYKENGLVNIPVVSVLTDYTAHPSYIQKNVDAYIVGDEDVSYILKNAGIDETKIHSFGIPVSSHFLNDCKVEEVRKKLELDDKFTVLLMGGSFGAGNIKQCLLEIIYSKSDFQVIVVTGRDSALKEKLEKLVEIIKPKKNVRILGFTRDMPELLSIGDVLVTKPGGLTTTEAIIKAIPLVIPYYIPGQEAENVDFLLNNGLALKTFKNYPLSTIIEILIDNPRRREEIVERMKRRRKVDSADKIARLTMELMER